MMVTNTTNVNIRLDKDVKAQAEKLFGTMGLTMSSAINLFVRQTLLQEKIPFEIQGKRYFSVEEVAGKNWREGLDDIEDEWE
ncbi:type II toxin-antitoxin system RelB/DinJ family antitoxin [Lactococcus nasutitermitis]|uniref:Type II toxin-antitoxin system RelB/DinJ family antitoxin n=1 Tax=Lactococcus nasutitermitis TaxID=1652957 RepID=A0ABV9JE05_9LACT|nr:type II toxin-antitoxin system RelB/DinJ family antitoxin [Lactococcus nasutitermitis]